MVCVRQGKCPSEDKTSHSCTVNEIIEALLEPGRGARGDKEVLSAMGAPKPRQTWNTLTLHSFIKTKLNSNQSKMKLFQKGKHLRIQEFKMWTGNKHLHTDVLNWSLAVSPEEDSKEWFFISNVTLVKWFWFRAQSVRHRNPHRTTVLRRGSMGCDTAHWNKDFYQQLQSCHW